MTRRPKTGFLKPRANTPLEWVLAAIGTAVILATIAYAVLSGQVTR